jgi:uncharacterized protein
MVSKTFIYLKNNRLEMIVEETLAEIIQYQQERMKEWDIGLKRTALNKLPNISAHALIVTGIRRSGKSTLLFQLLQEKFMQ